MEENSLGAKGRLSERVIKEYDYDEEHGISLKLHQDVSKKESFYMFYGFCVMNLSASLSSSHLLDSLKILMW